MKPTIQDLAAFAGVSTATVDRVLNQRPGVGARTQERIWASARTLGYPMDTAGRSGPAEGLDVLLPSGANPFMVRLASAVLERASAHGVVLRVHRIALSTGAFAETLSQVALSSQGIAVVAPDQPAVREALRSIVRRGTPVFTLVTDLPGVARLGYIGTDNRAAGRLAGQVLARFAPPGGGPVALMVGAESYVGHRERADGFRAVLAEHAPRLRLLAVRETLDQDQACQAALDSILAEAPDLVGIYNTGSGAETVAEKLEQRALGDRVVLIGHELTEGTRRRLLTGSLDAVIDQNVEAEAVALVEAMIAARAGRPVPSALVAAPVLILRENLPA